MKELKDMQPLNSNEDYLYGVNARLELLTNVVKDLVKVLKPIEVKKEEVKKVETKKKSKSKK